MLKIRLQGNKKELRRMMKLLRKIRDARLTTLRILCSVIITNFIAYI